MPFLLLLLAIVLAGCAPVPLQVVSPAADARIAALSRLERRQFVRFTTPAIRRVDARLMAIRGDSVEFDVWRVGSVTLPIAGLDSVWVRRDDSAGGATVGGIVLGLAGILTGSALQGLCDSSDCRGEASSIIGLTIFGATIGAGLGAMLGGAFSRWELVVPVSR